MTPTLDQIRRAGLEALREKLGVAGMVRFLRQFDNGHGDYSAERHAWVDKTTLDEIRRLTARKRRGKRK